MIGPNFTEFGSLSKEQNWELINDTEKSKF